MTISARSRTVGKDKSPDRGQRKLTASFVAVALSACASNVSMPAKVSDGVLVDRTGMTLYTFDRDAQGAHSSACNDKCAINWPPLRVTAADASSGDWTVITREDGSRQWAYKGKPLYLWTKDQKPGDRTGDGVNKVWQLARP